MTASRLPKVLANPALILFLLSPAIGELLSGSSPPAEFFTPFGLTMLLGLYGSGALLARELKVRWGKGMGSLLLLGYTPPLPQFLLAPATVVVLTLLAKRLPADWARWGTKPMRRPWFYATITVVGAVASGLTFLVVPNLQPPPAFVIALGVAIIYGSIRLLTRYNWREATDLHRLAIAVGSIAIFVTFAFFQEFDASRVDNTSGMALVGFVSIAGLAYLGQRVRARTRPADHRDDTIRRDQPAGGDVITGWKGSSRTPAKEPTW